ncbi:glycosyl hydrolase [Paenibacillus doosanensis]|uniref:glycosylhydrolase-like jelly roll fold domain-containing protein n=1 Tax=Paenibacillus doosanensis TaxID=1229154 RepID=UPI00218072E4|nr:glycosylhydrolase-like jelly roll fold domain-containing protein [Paenibacillus doosanensis]MCS7462627.1 glycosyl hydrolase [Paenibacillus doosanensis]
MTTNTDTSLEQQFLHPSDEFTPIPFWFWNDELTESEIVRQIADFADKGVMGFVIHPRIGIPESIPYLSDTYMGLVKAAVQEAERRGMTVILYDEAMYPSGAAKGLVVQDNPELASRGLKMTELSASEPVRLAEVLGDGDVLISAQAVRKKGAGIEPGASAVLEPSDGIVAFRAAGGDNDDWTILLFIETFSRGTIRGIHFGEDDGEPNAPASADLLNPLAVEKFIRLTHDRYYEVLSPYFGTAVRAMFTDEPDIMGRRHTKGLKAWTGGFLDYFIREGCEVTDLPLLWLEGDRADLIRRRYSKAVNKRMIESYYKPLAEWCGRHGIALTGHPAASDEIGLLEHFHIPGQDVVWRWVAPEDGKAVEGKHTTMAKCSSDAARHRGRRRNLNEFLGVCGLDASWALSAGDMKWYMDWLLVRGVNLLCPHAFYYSIDGPRRLNERPPDVGPNNIWWPHYRRFADYMKRMSWLMTDSVNVTPIAVLGREDWLPWRSVKPLFENQREFNYLEESLLVAVCGIEHGRINIAGQTYSVVIVEDDGLWEEETKRVLRGFIDQGGQVIAIQAHEGAQTVPSTVRLDDPSGIAAELERLEPGDLKLEPSRPDIRASHVIKDGNHFYVLVNEGERPYEGALTIRTEGRAELWDPWEGRIDLAPVSAEAGSVAAAAGGMTLSAALERRQALVYRIDPSRSAELSAGSRRRIRQSSVSIDGPWNVSAGRQAVGTVTPQTESAEAAAAESAIGRLSLGNWAETEGLEHFAGTITYTNTVSLESGAAKADSLILDLGEAHEMAEVWVNGEWAGVRMWHPYTFAIGALAKQGMNELRIDVTNNLSNRYDRKKLPSGLIGPVEVSVYE